MGCINMPNADAIDGSTYPQLSLLMWDRANKIVAPNIALSLYERKSKWIDVNVMDERERTLFDRLVNEFGGGVFNG